MTQTVKQTRSLVASDIIFQSLSAADFQAYRQLRLDALASEDCRYFVECGERSRTDDDWRNVCTEKFDENGRGISVGIGAFWQGEENERLVGSALVERWIEDKTGETAIYRAIYVRPEFREGGVAEKIELLQDVWAIRNGYTKSIFTIRADKEKWLNRQINIFGAKIVGTVMYPYANGETFRTHFLERHLQQPSRELRASAMWPVVKPH